MKIFFVSLMQVVLLFASASAHAQLNCRTTVSGNQRIVTCRHANGKPSTIESWDTTAQYHRSGNIKGYDASGRELFSFGLRRFAGHASVDIQYHPNGQVSKVHYSSAPDAGIQWYRTDISFDEQGKETGRIVQDHDGPGTLRPSYIVQPPSTPPTQPTVHPKPQQPPVVPNVPSNPPRLEAKPSHFLSQLWLVNASSSPVKLRLWGNEKPEDFSLQAQDSIKVVEMLSTERFSPLNERYGISLLNGNNLSLRLLVDELRPGQKRYRYVAR